MAQGEHRSIDLTAGDTVILSATPIPGNETKVYRVINNLVRLGVIVHHGRNAPVHVSGHAARDELATFMNVVAPRAFVPVHGEYRHLVASAELARTVGVGEVEICEDGDRVVLRDGKLTVERGAFPAGYVYIDGSGVGDLDGVLRDRRHLADDGVLIVTVGVDMASGEIVVGPEVDSHGVTDDPKDLHRRDRRRRGEGGGGAGHSRRPRRAAPHHAHRERPGGQADAGAPPRPHPRPVGGLNRCLVSFPPLGERWLSRDAAGRWHPDGKGVLGLPVQPPPRLPVWPSARAAATPPLEGEEKEDIGGRLRRDRPALRCASHADTVTTPWGQGAEDGQQNPAAAEEPGPRRSATTGQGAVPQPARSSDRRHLGRPRHRRRHRRRPRLRRRRRTGRRRGGRRARHLLRDRVVVHPGADRHHRRCDGRDHAPGRLRQADHRDPPDLRLGPGPGPPDRRQPPALGGDPGGHGAWWRRRVARLLPAPPADRVLGYLGGAVRRRCASACSSPPRRRCATCFTPWATPSPGRATGSGCRPA